MGEFGFLTADGVYHVTVYATDEDGNYRVLSMKNLRRMEPQAMKMLLASIREAHQRAVVSQPNNPITMQPLHVLAANNNPTTPPPFKVISTTESVTLRPITVASCSNCRVLSKVYPTGTSPVTQSATPSPDVINYDHTAVTPDPVKLHATERIPTKAEVSLYKQTQEPLNKDNHSGQLPILNYNQSDNQSDREDPNYNGFTFTQAPNQLDDADRHSRKLIGVNGDGNRNQVLSSPPAPFNNPPTLSGPLNNVLLNPGPAHEGRQPPPNLIHESRIGLAGGSEQFNEIGNLYKFNYTVGYHGHNEVGDASGRKEGGYHVIGRDGIRRTVSYTADENGFHPIIKYEAVSDVETPREETEKEAGLKGYEFKWFYVNKK